MAEVNRSVSAIDLFCGVGGLSYGLQQSGIKVMAGFDIDARCKYPFEKNIDAAFIDQDVRTITGKQLARLWEPDSVRVLAGCAPCQPFSPHRRGQDTSEEKEWSLLGHFGRLVDETLPDMVTMENVPRIAKTEVFQAFIRVLQKSGYEVTYKSCYGPEYGLPQNRRRLVLIASKHGRIDIPKGDYKPGNYVTVRKAIYGLPDIASGQTDALDPLHKSRSLSDLNLRRIRASRPGGSWKDWPEELRSPCHRRASGATFRNVYSRMEWNEPAPTITTMAYNFGTGRFGHPEQDRAISLREAAILQSFPLPTSSFNPVNQLNSLRSVD